MNNVADLRGRSRRNNLEKLANSAAMHRNLIPVIQIFLTGKSTIDKLLQHSLFFVAKLSMVYDRVASGFSWDEAIVHV